VTHPFHPLFGREFEFVAHRQNWGDDRVHLHDENGALFSLPAGLHAAGTNPITAMQVQTTDQAPTKKVALSRIRCN
jgi:hypothetical protein